MFWMNNVVIWYQKVEEWINPQREENPHTVIVEMRTGFQ